VTDIVERWQGDQISDPEAVEALKSVEKAVLGVEREAEQKRMDGAEFAIFTHLSEETPEAIDSEDQAQEVAREIVSQFRQRVDRGYDGWRTNQQTISEVTRILLDSLAKEHELGHLILDDEGFEDTIRTYLIQNHG
jgi:type I restriction enzyme R subunit